MGSGSHNVLGITSDDPVLSWVGPLGLALAAGTALVVDACDQLRRGERSLADLVGEGPRLEELSPGRQGVAIIRSGLLEPPELESAVGLLSRSWPAVIIRSPGSWEGPMVPYRGLYPGRISEEAEGTAVWQPAPGVRPRSVSGPVLPRLGRVSVMDLLTGRIPRARRWVSSWRAVWRMPWA